jgi:hypothetical protein
MKINNVMVYTGYVESSSWSALMFTHEDGFDSVEAALHHLGECILTGLKLEEKYSYFPKCCIASMEKVDKFCSKCGRDVQKRAIDRERLSQQIHDLRSGDNDSIGQEIWETLENNNWHLWGKFGASNNFTNVVVLGDHGEITLANAAFGRVFNDGPLNEDNAKFYGENDRTESERRKCCKDKYCISAPKGAKFFIDD